MTITTSTGWEAIGTHRELCGERVFTVDAPSIGPERHEPLLVLHGFPTSSFDYAAVLDRLRAGRPRAPARHARLRALGQARPPLHHGPAGRRRRRLRGRRSASTAWPCSPTTWATPSAASCWPAGPRAPGRWRSRAGCVTNGSIYIEQAHLTDGQQLLLGLPDELLPAGVPIDAASITPEPARHVQPADAARARGLARGPGPAGRGAGRARRRPPGAAAAHPLHRGAAGQRASLHGGDRGRPLATARRLGPRRPHRRPVHGRHPRWPPAPTPPSTASTASGHYPMVEAPRASSTPRWPGRSDLAPPSGRRHHLEVAHLGRQAGVEVGDQVVAPSPRAAASSQRFSNW